MARISSYDSNSISTLFSSLNTKNSKAGTDVLGINYSDYATIRNGSYYKLMKAYYAKDTASGDKKTSSSTSTANDTTKTLAQVEDKAGALSENTEKLYKNNALFHKTTTTDASGKTTTDYDTDAIYKAINGFVSDYNAALKAADESTSTKITNATDDMIRETSQNKAALADIGITIDSKDALVIDADKFKAADMNTVKSLFNGTGSYAYNVAVNASKIDYYAKNEVAKANTYGATGKYNYNYSSGTIYNSRT